ncbi:MYND finger containing protein [Novymonas esmeraldas]|uniref:MYND finger containing protein n=1 Tax=Novymonas esmeraldas TaxID=1808958 RepID=A0AAW0F6T9_9TRYP
MWQAAPFLRGGTPTTTLSELVEVLSSASPSYSRWRCVACYPRRWCHDAVANDLTAPVFFFLFGAREERRLVTATAAADGAGSSIGSAWHLLYRSVVSDGAVPAETFASGDGTGMNDGGGGGGGIGALRVLLREVPAGLLPSRGLEWYSVARGIAYECMGLLSATVFTRTLVPALCDVLGKCWRPLAHGAEDAGVDRAPHTPSHFAAHYVVDGGSVEVVHLLVEGRCTSASAAAPPASPVHLAFVTEVVDAAVQWMCAGQKVATDASAPSITETGWHILYPLMSSLRACLYTSLFLADGARGGETAQLRIADADVQALSGLARLRAERDAGAAEWRRQVGQYVAFTLPAAHGCVGAADERPFQHVLLLQRPIVAKTPIGVDNRDTGPLTPQPIGAELHLFQDRGDIHYTLEQLGNRANVRFCMEDALHDDGELLVQLTPVEGVPFSDLEAYFTLVPAASAARASGAAAQCAGSCCAAVVPRAVFRRPTGRVSKANPVAHALPEVEVMAPTTAMLHAAAAALECVSAELEEVPRRTDAGAAPVPGYTLRMPAVDFSALPERKCGWCGRRREVLQRCGGCKAVSYCSKRHQALDWKEGVHKAECKLWRRARELQESVVAPWAAAFRARSRAAARTGHGWSCAATLVQFLVDVNASGAVTPASPSSSSPGDAVVSVHVAGDIGADCVDAFVRSFADDADLRHALAACAEGRQYRVLVCSPTLAPEQRGVVWAVGRSEEKTLWQTPATGVLGDAWHCEGANAASTHPASALALLRLCGTPYHALERHRGSGDAEHPRAVLFFGPANGDGCTYLTAALEVFAGHDVGLTPLRLVDSSYVGALRTRAALAARVANSELCPANVKRRVAALVATACKAEAPVEVSSSGGGDPASARDSFVVRFNADGAAPPAPAADVASTRPASGPTSAATASCAVMPVSNCFLWDVMPADCS